ncbi:Asp_protease_2 domain-containing protein, partial [Cephalotus follicularis]
WLRNNIFHTKCTSKGKTCNVIIDGGSCENVVSKTMVEKLGLKTEKHPWPYRLLWFRKGNEVTMDKRCLVQFSIGHKYHDELWCDVVPMDAFHMLLGRSWQYGRRTKHNGFKNTYAFKKDGVTIILGPTDMRKNTKEMDNNLLSRSAFEEAVEESNAAFALVVVEENEGSNIIPSQVLPLLDVFKDVVSEELPSGLPPMRDIQHCIDFVLRAVILNRSAYQMSPKESYIGRYNSC